MNVSEGKTNFFCRICDRYFLNRSQLLNHDIKKHNSKVKHLACNECEFKTTHKSYMFKHRRQHTGGPYKCTVCDKKFLTSLSHKRHEKVHENKYMCKECGVNMPSNSLLEIHVMSKHSEDRGLECSKCEYQPPTIADLRRHMRVHSEDRPFECPECDSKFKSKANLFLHMGVHSGSTPSKCTICDSNFNNNVSLRKHLPVHNGQELFTCSQCNSKFSKSYLLKNHMKTHNNNTTD